jgi:hypothetical protein
MNKYEVITKEETYQILAESVGIVDNDYAVFYKTTPDIGSEINAVVNLKEVVIITEVIGG